MTIATMEALEALRPGTVVKVGVRNNVTEFTRTTDGFAYDGVTVDTGLFSGHIAAGQVTTGPTDPEPGDYYVSSSYHYIILAVSTDTVSIMRFHGSRFENVLRRAIEEVRGYNWTRVAETGRPEWYGMAYTIGQQMETSAAAAQDYAQQLTVAQRDRDTARRDLRRITEARAAQIQVVVTGVARLPLDKADGKVPEGATVVDVLASWRREFTVTTEPVTGCQCGTVTRERVIEMLGLDPGSALADFGFQVDCGRHN